MELLSPAGSMEAVTAAVQNGADAVYLGFGAFNARRNAKNFTEETFAAAAAYCHERGVKVYLTLNTLLTDRELPSAAELAAKAAGLGADAVLVQDLGVLRAVQQAAPDLPIHASTQMTVCDLDGVKQCADLGMRRVVLARELPASAIGYICEHAPIEIEVFAHGALCVSYSGQCFFSAMLGGRSGNRGLCAQPCRMRYGWGGRPDRYPLSLKDLCLADQIQTLQKLGVSCIKLEGRMRRAEYVAVITRIYATLLRENRLPTPEELQMLEDAFSRDGFTKGYFEDKPGAEMFGVRDEKTPEFRRLFSEARQTYVNQETPRVEITFYALVRRGEPVQVGVQDRDGNVCTAVGSLPETAEYRELTAPQVEKQLIRTGGTPFRCVGTKALVEPGLNVPLRTVNALRRQVLEELRETRRTPPPVVTGQFHAGVRYENPKEPPALAVSVRRTEQITPELLRRVPRLLYVPCGELAEHPACLRGLSSETQVVPVLPRVAWDRERPRLAKELEQCRKWNVAAVLAGNFGMARWAREQGFSVRADFGIPVFNAQALKELKRLSFVSATASFELKLAQIRDLSKAIPLEAVVYGRLPLMLTELCILKNRTGQCVCGETTNTLTDRKKGERFPVLPAPGCRNEIFNNQPLFLADKPEWKHAGLTWARIMFTTEPPALCVQILERYQGEGNWTPKTFTRGLYYRGVE